jgi:uncharacterized protein YbaP (TraB family)
MSGARPLRHLTAGLLAACLATPALADPAIWKVSDDDSSIHLYGSVHIFPRPIEWRTPQLDSLLIAADYVVFEVVMDVEAYATVTQFSLNHGRLPKGQTMAELLGPADYQRLHTVAAQIGHDPLLLEQMQPWLAAMTLITPPGLEFTGGVEVTLDPEIAPERKRSLETAAEQMSFLAGAPLDEQLISLRSTLDAIEGGVELALEPLIDAWARGDDETLLRLVEEQMQAGTDPAFDRLITQRNARWIAPLEQMLANNDDVLVIVGAAHLVGDIGVPALLAAKGYTVERVDAPAEAGTPSALPGALGRASTRR